MAKFSHNDIVTVRSSSTKKMPSERAWIVGVFEERPGTYFAKFPEGTVYTVEFEDGSSDEFHEADLELAASATRDNVPIERKRAG